MAAETAGVGQTLSVEMVLAKMKQPAVDRVKNVNLWGCSLSDVSVLAEFPRLEKVSLSVNKIRSLRYFRRCRGLTELYLRKNEINDLTTVGFLKSLPNLRILWLCDNPCADNELYRAFVIRLLPRLEKLDMHDVSDEERRAAASNDDPTFLQLVRAAEEVVVSVDELERQRRTSDETKLAESGGRHPDSVRAARSLGEGGNVFSAITLLLRDLDDGALVAVQELCSRLLERRREARRTTGC